MEHRLGGVVRTPAVEPIDQGSAVVDLSAELQPEKGKEMRSNYSAVKRENGRSGVGCNPEVRLQGDGVEGT
jgi:hypothetical protein